MTSQQKHIEVSTRGGIQTLRLVRPEKRNAVTRAMYDALSEALAAGDRDPGVAVHVILGSNGTFTAGNDLSDFLAADPERPETIAPVLRFLDLLPQVAKPIVAGVEGAAVGIGTTLLLHCDLVYAAPTATFATPFVDLGLVPENASSLLATLRLGYARAFELLALGEPLTAERAREAGLINCVVPAAELEPKVMKAAQRLAAKPPEALRLTRRLLRAPPEGVLERSRRESEEFSRLLASPEAREAISAFLEKRPPDFSRLGRSR